MVYGFNPLARWRYRKLPGPRPQWQFGNLREVLTKGNHQAYMDWQRSYGSVFRVRFEATSRGLRVAVLPQSFIGTV